MKLNTKKTAAYQAVRECLAEIVQDFDSEAIKDNYRIGAPYGLQIRKPEVIYKMVLDNGLEASVESFTENLIKETYGLL